MAKKKKADEAPASGESTGASSAPAAGGKPESVSGYFRKLFHESPKLLKETSNQKLLDRWLADHPGQEVTKSIRNNLANLKSVLRSKKRTRVAEQAEDRQESGRRPHVDTLPTGGSPLEALEHQIDECLVLAKGHDREGLESVIGLLRRARNAVVWKMGQ